MEGGGKLEGERGREEQAERGGREGRKRGKGDRHYHITYLQSTQNLIYKELDMLIAERLGPNNFVEI